FQHDESFLRRPVQPGEPMEPLSMIKKNRSLLWMGLAFDFGELPIERLAINSKHVGSLVLVASGLFEDLEDIFLLHLIHWQRPLTRIVEYAPVAASRLNH